MNLNFPNKKYNIIYADPPWNYNSKMMNSSAIDHYNTMSLEDICNLPVKDISADDCILFMWVTFPKLNEFIKVVNSWGFEYKTCGFVWVKTNKVNHETFFMGQGRWTRGNAEICIIATKGKVKRLSNSIRQLHISPLETHSKKPNEIRNKIVELVGNLPRIELFARQKCDGWDCWGNEVNNEENDNNEEKNIISKS